MQTYSVFAEHTVKEGYTNGSIQITQAFSETHL